MTIDALFYANAPARLSDQIRLAKGMARDGGLSVEFLLQPDTMTADMAGRVREAGFPARFLGASPNAPTDGIRDAEGGAGRIVRLARAALRWNTPAQWLIARRILGRLEVLRLRAQAILDEVRPRAVLAFGDRHGGGEFALLKAARATGIPVILPYMAYSNMQSLTHQRRQNPYLRHPPFAPLYFRWVRRRYPSTILDGIFFYPPSETDAYGRFGALPTNPWTMGCGLSDLVGVDNQSTFERYREYGVPAEKLRIVGDTAYDDLFEAYVRREAVRKELRRRYGMSPDKKLVLVSLPQFAEHDMMPWDQHFREIAGLMEKAAGLGESLLVSLHPKMDPARYVYLEKEYPCHILPERLVHVLPAADLFVAINSSTVIWAVLCGIPSVVADYFGLGLGSVMFDFLSTPRVVREREALADCLHEALRSLPEFSGDWAALSRDKVFDGRTLERYLALLREPAGTKP